MAPPQAATQGRQSILPLFPLLSSHQLATRLDASVQLLSSLPLAAAAPTSTASAASDPDTPYALKRLIAGLASSNESARQGFAVALSQLVALLPDERAKHVLPQLIEQTTSKAGMDSREERDLLFARLMGLHALVRSGVVVRPSLNDAGEAWQEVVQALVSLANKKTWIREPSYWVVCEALRALLESEAEWKDECVKWAVQRLVNDAREKAKGWGPEKVAIVLVLQSHGVSADWSSVLSPSFPSGSLLSRSSLSTLASALKGSASSSSSSDPSSSAPKQGVNATKTSKGAAAPAPGQAPHFVWTLLRDVYFPAKEEKAAAVEDKVKFADFWRVCVDQSLFASPSLPLKSLGFSLITLFLPSLPSTELLSLLNLPNTLRVFANHLRSSAGAGGAEKTLSRVADKLASSALPAYLAQEPSAALPLLKALTGAPHSSYNAFEPKVLERFVARLPLSGVKGWISHLQTMILSPSAATDEDFTLSGAVIEGEEDLLPAEREKRVTAQRTWALDQLLHVGKNGGVIKDEEAVKGLLEFLAVVGWFEVKKEGSKGARSYIPSPAFTSAHRLAARTRFFSILTALVSLPSTPAASSSSTPSTPTVAGGPAWLARALALLDALKADEKHFSPADAEDEDGEDDEASEVEEKVKELYAKLAPSSPAAAPAAEEGKKGKKGRKSASSAAEAAPAVDAKDAERRAVARSLIEGVRLVSWDEGAEDAADVLESTVDAVSALFPALFPSNNAGEDASMNDDDDEEEEAPEPTTILMDLLLALLRRPSAFVKQVASVVLKGFADEVGSQAVELVVEQWRVDEEEEEGEKEDEEMKDVDKKEEAKKGKKVEGADEEDEDEDEEDDSDDEDFEVDEAFKNELLAALEAGGMAVPNGATGSDDEESDEDEESPVAKGDDEDEEILDDDAMLELDERLADIFRANGGGRRSKKRDRTDSLHYRLRCLDLLDVLAHHNPSSPFLIPTFVPLFNLVRTATSVEHELQTKASKLLRFVVQPRKTASSSSSSSTAPQPSEETAASALEALDELYRITASVDAADLAPLAAQVSLALIKAAVSSAPSTAPAEISRLAGASFASYVNTKNAKTKCQPALMSEAAKRAPAAVWGARDEVLELAKGEKVNAFRKVQAFEVVQTLVTSYAALKTPESKSALLAFLPSYRSSLYSVISSSLSSSSTTGSLDAPRLKLLAKNALSAARLTVQLSSQSEAATLWQPQEWAALLDPAQGKVSDRFKGATGVLSLIKQLVGVLGQSVESKPAAAGGKKEKKRKAADSVDAAAPAATATPSKSAAAGSATPKSSKKAKTAAASTPSAPTPAAAPASAAKPKPEEEVQDESIEDEAVDGEAGQGTPNGKKGKKKDKKRRRSEGGKA